MSIQEYVCPIHGKQEVFIRKTSVPAVTCCRHCGKPIPHTVSLPAPPRVTETWNDIANRCRVNPYDQAKEQLKNHDREQQERHDARPMKITEEQVQVVAKGIDEQDRKPEYSEEQVAQAKHRAAVKAHRKKQKETNQES